MLTQPAPAEIERAVHDTIRAIVTEEKGACPAFSGADRLEAVGLESLDLARLVAELEGRLGRDPFAELVPITSVRTVDDLVNAYRTAFSPDARPRDEDDEDDEDAPRRRQAR